MNARSKQQGMVFIILASALVLLANDNFPATEEVRNWTHFRGSKLNGISEESSIPVSWNDSTNIDWKSEIKGRGWSSPVIYGDQIWCTTASTDGEEMFAVCTDFNTGENLFTLKIFEPDSIFRKHSINSYATPTPCIEEGFVYVHFGRYGTACLDTKNGQIVWTRDDLECRHAQGPGSSPIIHNNMLILHLEGVDVQYLVALDKRTGKTIWRTERPSEPYEPLKPIEKKAYITPIVIHVNGTDLLISNGAAICIAYNVETGDEVWRIVAGSESTIASPVISEGLLYFYTGHVRSPDGDKYSELLAVDPTGEGDVSLSHVRWRIKTPPLQLSTPIVKNGLLYTIDSKGILLCLNAKTGETIWSEKLKGKYNSSLLWAAGNIYFSSIRGETFVIREGRDLDVIAENSLDGEIWATPAFIDGCILLRTSEALYKIR